MTKAKNWKTYLVQTVFTSTVVVGLGLLIAHDISLISDYIDYKKEQREIKATVDSLHQVIQGMSPEKLSELRQLYNETYKIFSTSEAPDSTKPVILGSEPAKIVPELTDLNDVLEWRRKGDVAVVNDTVVVHDYNKKIYSITFGISLYKAPQINVNYFKYDGNNEDLKKLVSRYNPKAFRQMVVYHELQHVDNFDKVLRVPVSQRTRSLHAADEFFATVAGMMYEYAEFNAKSKDWDKTYQSKVNVKDVNFRLPENSQQIVDSVLLSAIDKLQSMPIYRKKFVLSEKTSFDQSIEDAYQKDIPNSSEAIKQMQSSFKINGQRTDLFSLASDKVRKRAEEFLNSRDDDMRLVMQARNYNIKL